jgi:hypothetical protein
MIISIGLVFECILRHFLRNIEIAPRDVIFTDNLSFTQVCDNFCLFLTRVYQESHSSKPVYRHTVFIAARNVINKMFYLIEDLFTGYTHR